MKPILFKLENCHKCEIAKDYLDKKNIEYKSVLLSKKIDTWTNEQKSLTEKHKVVPELKKTAPVLACDNGLFTGYLSIKKWANE